MGQLDQRLRDNVYQFRDIDLRSAYQLFHKNDSRIEWYRGKRWGGDVSLTAVGHPFVTGQDIIIAGTTGYDGHHTLTAAPADKLQFTDTFAAETFDGVTTVIQLITSSGGGSRMAQDSTGALYLGRGPFGVMKLPMRA